MMLALVYTVKRFAVFPSPGGMSLTKFLAGIIYLFPARKSLVSDIPAGNGKIDNPFLQCSCTKAVSETTNR